MKFEPLNIHGAFRITPFQAEDDRGLFTKVFSAIEDLKHINFVETYYSTSHKNVIRGLHFQTPPHAHHKVVTLLNGEIMDVILDLRKDSPTYLKHEKIHLNQPGHSILIPLGCAHGFLSLQNNTTLLYNVSSVYNSNSDKGIRYDSAEIDWGIDSPIISKRDAEFTTLSALNFSF